MPIWTGNELQSARLGFARDRYRVCNVASNDLREDGLTAECGISRIGMRELILDAVLGRERVDLGVGRAAYGDIAIDALWGIPPCRVLIAVVDERYRLPISPTQGNDVAIPKGAMRVLATQPSLKVA